MARATAGGVGEGEIQGVEEMHQIDLRVDGKLVKRFALGGELKGPDPGTLIAVAEDDIQGIYDFIADAEIDFLLGTVTRLLDV